MTPIEIPDELRARIYAHALAAFPAECCGYLTGGADRVDAAVPCTNAQASGAETSFVIEGAELLQFARAFDTAQPPRIVYHSHPNGRAYFSELDRAMADGPAYPVQHVVIGCTAGAITEIAQFAWSASANAYVEIARWRP